jgi:hypothetical protein
MRVAALLALSTLFLACPSEAPPADDDDGETPTPEPPGPDRYELSVRVLLDGAPVAEITVMQGGLDERWTTDADGLATIDIDTTLDAEHWVVASHPEARQFGVEVPARAWELMEPLEVELTRFDPTDNPDFRFRDPGEPAHRDSVAKCAHCHVTMNVDWYDSPHRTSASNPAVQDLYAGVRAADDQAQCETLGGRWRTGVGPGTGEAEDRCYLGDGVLPALNECGDQPCDTVATVFGGCADCHAPGIDGVLGGRDLLEAEGYAYEYGIHCDVCHHVESIAPSAEPGTAGRLHMVRPSEPGLFGQDFLPSVFGPYDDVPTAIMGNITREVFADALFCSGCHEQNQAVLVPGAALDTLRWPGGRLPIHTTYSEWADSSLNPSTSCQSCHMPPDPSVLNSADRQLFLDGGRPGLVMGWDRTPGTVREHSWIGPRQPESGMLLGAASLSVEQTVEAGELTVEVTTRNSGAGHALPTGEPMRSMLLLVEATCDGEPLAQTGGDVVPDYGGAHAVRAAGEDWTVWPGAVPGQVIRVVRRTGEWRDYSGYGAFGDGTFDATAKGLPIEEIVGESVIQTVEGDVVTLDGSLPVGDVAYRVDAAGLPVDGAPAQARAGSPGFGFARVLAAEDGRRMVPHFLAVDVASDNRLLPGQEWTSEHRFAVDCAEPAARATLVHRAYPLPLAAERGWDLTESVMVEATR